MHLLALVESCRKTALVHIPLIDIPDARAFVRLTFSKNATSKTIVVVVVTLERVFFSTTSTPRVLHLS